MSAQHWFALRVRRNSEWGVASGLKGKGYGEYLPVYQKVSHWSDRDTLIERPLFPGFVFGRFDPNQRLPILTIPGVIQVLSVGNKPAPIDEQELESVRKFVASGLPVEPWPFLRSGDLVAIRQGAFAGLEGILVQIKSRYRLVVSLSLLQRSVAVEIDRTWVARACGYARTEPFV